MITNEQRIKEWRAKANGGDPSSPTQPMLDKNKNAPVLSDKQDKSATEKFLDSLKQAR